MYLNTPLHIQILFQIHLILPNQYKMGHSPLPQPGKGP